MGYPGGQPAGVFNVSCIQEYIPVLNSVACGLQDSDLVPFVSLFSG